MKLIYPEEFWIINNNESIILNSSTEFIRVSNILRQKDIAVKHMGVYYTSARFTLLTKN